MSEEVKKTPLFAEHKKLNGKMVEFAGWLLPVQYDGIVKEHLCVREHVGIFDVSHMGEILVKGNQALDFLQYLTVNDVAKLVEGQAQYTMMCYENGGIVDDILIYRIEAQTFLLIVNASNIEKDFNWLNALRDEKGMGQVVIENQSDLYCQIAVQGPKSKALMDCIVDGGVPELNYYCFTKGFIQSHAVIISRTGYTGEFGYEIYCSNDGAATIWQQLMEKGKSLGVCPVGLGARDTLRFEVCFPLYGNELSKDISPIEAGLKWVVKLEKKEFVGKVALEKQIETGLQKKLIAIELIDKGIARHEHEIYNEDGTHKIGVITSGTKGPSVGKSVALGYVEANFANVGSFVSIKIRDVMKKAVIVKKPFLLKS